MTEPIDLNRHRSGPPPPEDDEQPMIRISLPPMEPTITVDTQHLARATFRGIVLGCILGALIIGLLT